ncbi:ABC transporter permease [Schaalia vaccimaxillae]|uniref:ABC transporter permease n=1 Tax=Schaalia vaccimaxillae TaxID=183916 RepID=UPI0003B679A5|nr:ABC transporter permease [Schaalia vaccimaxillae]
MKKTRPHVIRAELIRQHRTFTLGASLVSLAVTAFCMYMAAATVDSGLAYAQGRWNGNILGWLSFYPFAVLIPLGMLMGALCQYREQRWREGGTGWRSVNPQRVVLARIGVLTLGSFLCQLTVFFPILIQSLVVGEGLGPVNTWMALLFLFTLSQSAGAAWGLLFARFAGGASVAVAPAVGFIWSMAGAIQAEGDSWLVQPWAWLPHSLLPLLGVHGNSINLEPGAQAWTYPVWPAFPLTVLIGTIPVVVLGLLGNLTSSKREALSRIKSNPLPDELVTNAVSSSDARQPSIHREDIPVRHPRRRCSLALIRTLPWIVWLSLSVVLVVILTTIRLTYSPSRALDVLGLVGVPVASSIVGTMTWRAVSEPWRSLLTRDSPTRMILVLVAIPSGVLSLVFLAAGLVTGFDQIPLSSTTNTTPSFSGVHMLLLLPFITWMLTTVSMALTQRFGIGISVAVTVVGVLDSLVIAGNETLSSYFWRLAPWGWATTAGMYPNLWPQIVLLSVLATTVALGILITGSGKASTIHAQ